MGSHKKNIQETIKNAPEKLDTDMFYGLRLDEEQKRFADSIWSPDYDIIFCNSKAGSGKTTIATGVANLLVYYGKYTNIVYIMSPYGERKQGWLPGTITEKSAVYFEAFYQALIKCNVNPNTSISEMAIANQKYGTGYISCITDTFLRGTNLDDAVIIIDEAQNYTISQLQKVLTRVGSRSKVIVIGHDQQCDLDDTKTSGFIFYLNHFASEERAAVCELTKNYRGWISRHADNI